MNRFACLWNTPFPYERRVLIGLKSLQCLVLAGWGAGAILVTPWLLVLAPVVGILWADFPEHWLKRPLLGYTYNPRVMAGGEFEGWTGPLDPDPRFVRFWENHKYDLVYVRAHSTAHGIPTFLPYTVEGNPGAGHFGEE